MSKITEFFNRLFRPSPKVSLSSYPEAGSTLDSLGDVIIDAPATGQLLEYSADTDSWHNANPPEGAGDVVGPASALDHSIARFDGTTGKLLQDTLTTIDNDGSLNVPVGENYLIDGVPVSVANLGDFLANGELTDQQILRYVGGEVGKWQNTSNAHAALGDLTSADDHAQYILNAPAATARNLITSADKDAVPVTIKGADSQAANLFDFRNAVNAIVASIAANGDLLAGNTTVKGTLALQETDGTDLLTIAAAALATGRSYVIPDAGGSAIFVVSTTTSPAQGDILYFNGTTFVSLPAGIDGYFLKTQGAGQNPAWSQEARNNLTELTSSVLTITGGTGAVLGSGTTIQVAKASASEDGYVSKGDWSTFSAKYDGLPDQTGNAGRYLKSDGANESWETIPVESGAVAGYLSQSFTNETSVVVLHNFGAYPIVQVINGSGVVIAPQSITHDSTNQATVAFASPTSGFVIASVGAPYVANIKAKTVDYTLTTADTVILTNGTVTMTLPTAVGIEGKYFTIKNIHATAVATIEADGSETIDGALNFLIGPKAALQVISDGANWQII